ncbi:pro-resilin-like [Scylla paramamosain]|uniref:pro-resilin-like n=1 Tax=Scylla paramamosain TaxID=85552 RepID=UPI003083BDB1
MNTKVFFLLAGVAVALAAPDRPATSYGVPRDSGSFEHFRPSSDSFEHSASFEHFRPSSSSRSFESYESDESTEAKYAFQWSVEDESTGNDFDHQEARDGDDTHGVYTVRLPDGRLQTVTYIVDSDDGYVADVKYEGVARYPDSHSRESFESASGSFESYAPPRRSYFAPDSNESK